MHLPGKIFTVTTSLLCSMALVAPCFATALIDDDDDGGNYTTRDTRRIELIEGDKVVRQAPPKPTQLYYNNMPAAPTGSAAAFSTVGFSQDVIANVVSRYNKQLAPFEVSEISQSINILSNMYGLDPKLLTSLIAVESSFKPTAISSTGAIGLGQLKPDTARWLGVADPFNPADNLMGVAKYLRYLLNRYNGSVQHALAAYFQGQGTIDQQGINDGARYYISKVNHVFGPLY